MRPINIRQSADGNTYHFYDHDAGPDDFDDRLTVSKNKFEDRWVAGGFGYKCETWTIGDRSDVEWLLAQAKCLHLVADLVSLLGPSDEAIEDQSQSPVDESLESMNAAFARNSGVFQ